MDREQATVLAGKVQKVLQSYLHVRHIARGLPPHFTLATDRQTFIAHVRDAPVDSLKCAWARPLYLEYLEGLPDDRWKVHLRDALAIRDRRRASTATG